MHKRFFAQYMLSFFIKHKNIKIQTQKKNGYKNQIQIQNITNDKMLLLSLVLLRKHTLTDCCPKTAKEILFHYFANKQFYTFNYISFQMNV